MTSRPQSVRVPGPGHRPQAGPTDRGTGGILQLISDWGMSDKLVVLDWWEFLMRRRSFALMSAFALMVAGCSGGDSRAQDLGVANADEFIAELDADFDSSIVSQFDETVSASEGTERCFLSGTEKLNPNAFCGPLRVLGSDEGLWYAAAITQKEGADGVVLSRASVGWMESAAGLELHRPDGIEPADVTALAEPTAPRMEEQNFARLLPEGDLDAVVDWEEIEEVTLRAPATDLSVTATAELNQIPSELITPSSGDDGDPEEGTGEAWGSPSYYRPADGQRVTAWKVSLSEPTISGPATTGWRVAEAMDASARLSVTSGTQKLPVEAVVDQQGWGTAAQEEDAFTVSCPDGVPCLGTSERYVLLINADADTPAELIVSTGGEDQKVNLDEGTVSSSVSSVANSRSTLSLSTSEVWPAQTHTIMSEEELDEMEGMYANEDLALTYAGSIPAVYLMPFERTEGWAPEGRAWLIIRIEDDPQNVSSGQDLEYDWASTYTLTVGDDTLTPAAGAESRIIFDVPEDFSAGTFTYRPTGKVTLNYLESPVSFAVESGNELKIEFEE